MFHDLNLNLTMIVSVFMLMWCDLSLNSLKLMRKYGHSFRIKDLDDRKFALSSNVLDSNTTT